MPLTEKTITEQVLAAIDIVAANCPTEARAAQKLRQNVRENVANPLIPRRLSALIDNARGEADFSAEDLKQLGEVLVRLDAIRDSKPGPPKQFPLQMNLRLSDVEQDALERISEKTGEDRSEAIRRLVREADPGE